MPYHHIVSLSYFNLEKMDGKKLNVASVASQNKMEKLETLLSKFVAVANNINVSNLVYKSSTESSTVNFFLQIYAR